VTTAPDGQLPEQADLLGMLDRVVDARIEARLGAFAEHLGAVIARHVVAMLRSEDRVVTDGTQRLLTVPEAARLLSVSRSTVYELMKRGDLHAVKVGAARRIATDSLDAFRSSLKDGQRGGRPPLRRAPAA